MAILNLEEETRIFKIYLRKPPMEVLKSCGGVSGNAIDEVDCIERSITLRAGLTITGFDCNFEAGHMIEVPYSQRVNCCGEFENVLKIPTSMIEKIEEVRTYRIS